MSEAIEKQMIGMPADFALMHLQDPEIRERVVACACQNDPVAWALFRAADYGGDAE